MSASRLLDSKEFSHPPVVGDFQLGEVIGRGAYGCVYKGDFAAIKRVDKTRLNEKTAASVKGEVEILRKLEHKTILRIYDCVETKEDLYLILEFMENGSLVSVLDKFGPLPESLVILYLHQALLGLKYLHDNNVLHRDIKAANILINKDGDIKLADFGVASVISSDVTAKYSVVGTPYWMAPEAIELIPSLASDIWSIGATVLELLTGQPPYFSLSPISAIFRIVQDPHPPVPTAISELMTDFVMKCFIKDITSRPTAEQLLLHPIFTNGHSSRPSYKELKNTLRTLRGGKRKKAKDTFDADWNPVTLPAVPDAKCCTRECDEGHSALQEALTHETELRQERETTIQHLLQENDRLAKTLRDMSKFKTLSPEEFYKDYLITMAMSLKVINHNRGKELRIAPFVEFYFTNLDMKELLEKAKQKKIAIHELIEWVPRQIKKKSMSMSKTHLY